MTNVKEGEKEEAEEEEEEEKGAEVCMKLNMLRIYELLKQLFALVSFCSKIFYTFKTFLHLLKY